MCGATMTKRPLWVRLVPLILAVITAYCVGSTGSLDAGGFGAEHVRSDAAHVRVHAALGLGWTLYPDRRR